MLKNRFLWSILGACGRLKMAVNFLPLFSSRGRPLLKSECSLLQFWPIEYSRNNAVLVSQAQANGKKLVASTSYLLEHSCNTATVLWGSLSNPMWRGTMWRDPCGEEPRTLTYSSSQDPRWQPISNCQPYKWATLEVNSPAPV